MDTLQLAIRSLTCPPCDCLLPQVCPVILRLTQTDSLDDYRTEAVAVSATVVTVLQYMHSEYQSTGETRVFSDTYTEYQSI